MTRPVALDLCVGLAGWASGLIMEGYSVIGVDIEDMFAVLGEPKPDHFELVIQNICDVKGADYAHVALIVGSSPCQDFSYRAMPWKRAKALHAPFLGIYLFWQQFRIQREASEAAGRHIPMVVENVRGAIPWVGRSKWNFGSYHLWGDVPALMPATRSREAVKAPGLGAGWVHPDDPRHTPGLDFTRLAGNHADGRKVPGFRFDGSGKSFQSASVAEHIKHPGHSLTKGARKFGPDNLAIEIAEGRKVGGDRFFENGSEWMVARGGPKTTARKAASAKIAKIPLVLSRWIGRTYLPQPDAQEAA